MEKILVSACLVGAKVSYDGTDNYCNNMVFSKWLSEGRVVMVCPEVASGCSVPRPPVEIVGINGGAGIFNGTSKAMTKDGTDVSEMFISGARIALDLALQNNIKIAIFKSKSPSCGSSKIYDGNFNKTIIDGDGVTVSLLKQNGIEVYSEKEISMVVKRLEVLENPYKKIQD
ncbi:DUF523 domain-containing protein [Desulfobacterales bacterium HSG17]|nr:DUF523 domain-containing protein [Desulfobacterales bacterium HSG17]